LPVSPIAAYLFVLIWTSFPFTPAEPVLIGAGSLAAGGGLALGVVILAATAGSFVSDLLKYAIGRYGGPSLLRRLRRRPAGKRALAWVEARMAVIGPAVIVPSYLVPFGVVVATLLCGALRLPLRGVAVASAVGAACWATVYGLLGYAGTSVTGDPIVGAALGLTVALAIGWAVRRATTEAQAG
jgi:membrane-associated protein